MIIFTTKLITYLPKKIITSEMKRTLVLKSLVTKSKMLIQYKSTQFDIYYIRSQNTINSFLFVIRPKSSFLIIRKNTIQSRTIFTDLVQHIQDFNLNIRPGFESPIAGILSYSRHAGVTGSCLDAFLVSSVEKSVNITQEQRTFFFKNMGEITLFQNRMNKPSINLELFSVDDFIQKEKFEKAVYYFLHWGVLILQAWYSNNLDISLLYKFLSAGKDLHSFLLTFTLKNSLSVLDAHENVLPKDINYKVISGKLYLKSIHEYFKWNYNNAWFIEWATSFGILNALKGEEDSIFFLPLSSNNSIGPTVQTLTERVFLMDQVLDFAKLLKTFSFHVLSIYLEADSTILKSNINILLVYLTRLNHFIEHKIILFSEPGFTFTTNKNTHLLDKINILPTCNISTYKHHDIVVESNKITVSHHLSMDLIQKQNLFVENSIEASNIQKLLNLFSIIPKLDVFNVTEISVNIYDFKFYIQNIDILLIISKEIADLLTEFTPSKPLIEWVDNKDLVHIQLELAELRLTLNSVLLRLNGSIVRLPWLSDFIFSSEKVSNYSIVYQSITEILTLNILEKLETAWEAILIADNLLILTENIANFQQIVTDIPQDIKILKDVLKHLPNDDYIYRNIDSDQIRYLYFKIVNYIYRILPSFKDLRLILNGETYIYNEDILQKNFINTIDSASISILNWSLIKWWIMPWKNSNLTNYQTLLDPFTININMIDLNEKLIFLEREKKNSDSVWFQKIVSEIQEDLWKKQYICDIWKQIENFPYWLNLLIFRTESFSPLAENIRLISNSTMKLILSYVLWPVPSSGWTDQLNHLKPLLHVIEFNMINVTIKAYLEFLNSMIVTLYLNNEFSWRTALQALNHLETSFDKMYWIFHNIDVSTSIVHGIVHIHEIQLELLQNNTNKSGIETFIYNQLLLDKPLLKQENVIRNLMELWFKILTTPDYETFRTNQKLVKECFQQIREGIIQRVEFYDKPLNLERSTMSMEKFRTNAVIESRLEIQKIIILLEGLINNKVIIADLISTKQIIDVLNELYISISIAIYKAGVSCDLLRQFYRTNFNTTTVEIQLVDQLNTLIKITSTQVSDWSTYWIKLVNYQNPRVIIKVINFCMTLNTLEGGIFTEDLTPGQKKILVDITNIYETGKITKNGLMKILNIPVPTNLVEERPKQYRHSLYEIKFWQYYHKFMRKHFPEYLPIKTIKKKKIHLYYYPKKHLELIITQPFQRDMVLNHGIARKLLYLFKTIGCSDDYIKVNTTKIPYEKKMLIFNPRFWTSSNYLINVSGIKHITAILNDFLYVLRFFDKLWADTLSDECKKKTTLTQENLPLDLNLHYNPSTLRLKNYVYNIRCYFNGKVYSQNKYAPSNTPELSIIIKFVKIISRSGIAFFNSYIIPIINQSSNFLKNFIKGEYNQTLKDLSHGNCTFCSKYFEIIKQIVYEWLKNILNGEYFYIILLKIYQFILIYILPYINWCWQLLVDLWFGLFWLLLEDFIEWWNNQINKRNNIFK